MQSKISSSTKKYRSTASMQKIIASLSACKKLSHHYQHAKNQPNHQQTTEVTFSFSEFVSLNKKSAYCIHSWDSANFKVLWPEWPPTFLTILIQKCFSQLWPFMTLYDHVKNKAISSFFFWRYSWFKNPATWVADSIFQEPNFS